MNGVTPIETDRCPACGRDFLPGLHVRTCRECGRMICYGCRKLLQQSCLCTPCWRKKIVEALRRTLSRESEKRRTRRIRSVTP